MTIAVALGGCSSDKSSKAGSSTVPVGSVALSNTATTLGVGGAGSVTTTLFQPTPSVSTQAPSVPPTTAKASGTTATTVPGRKVTSPSDSVKFGDSGPGVIKIQKALVAQGYKVTADGKFGAKTQAAVKAFQTKNGLTSDGVVGPKTWAKLSASPTTTTVKGGTSTTVKGTTTTTSHP